MEEAGKNPSFPFQFQEAQTSLPSLKSKLITAISGFFFRLLFKKIYVSFPLISFGFQVEEEASDKDNKNCSNNGEQQAFFLHNSDLLSTQSPDYISVKA